MTCRLGGGIRLGWPVYPRPLTRGMCCAEWAAHPCLRQHAWRSPACSLRAGALCLRRRRPQRTPTLGHVRLTLQHCVVAGLACQSTSRLPAPPPADVSRFPTASTAWPASSHYQREHLCERHCVHAAKNLTLPPLPYDYSALEPVRGLTLWRQLKVMV